MTHDLERELHQHGASLQALAAALLSDSADAEDAVQEAWLAALEHPPKREGSFGGWIHTVLLNVAGKLLRRRRRILQRERSLERDAAQPGEDDAAIERETLRTVLDAVLGLPEPYRATIWERFFAGRSPTVIAERSGQPIATVKSRLQRGLSLLRQRMDRGDGSRNWRAILPVAFGIPSFHSTSGASVVLTEVLVMKFAWKLGFIALLLLVSAATFFLLQEDSDAVPHERAGLRGTLETDQAQTTVPLGAAPRTSVTQAQRVEQATERASAGEAESTQASQQNSRDPVIDPSLALPEPAVASSPIAFENPELFHRLVLSKLSGMNNAVKNLSDEDVSRLLAHIRPYVDEFSRLLLENQKITLAWRDRWTAPPGSPQPFRSPEDADRFERQFYDEAGRRMRVINQRGEEDGDIWVMVADPYIDRDIYEAYKRKLDYAEKLHRIICDWINVRVGKD